MLAIPYSIEADMHAHKYEKQSDNEKNYPSDNHAAEYLSIAPNPEAISLASSSTVQSLATLLESNQMGSFIVADPNLDGMPIVYASDAFLSMTHYTHDEVIGRNCRFLQGSETDYLTARRIGDAVANRKEYTVQILNYKKNGESFWNLLHLVPITYKAPASNRVQLDEKASKNSTDAADQHTSLLSGKLNPESSSDRENSEEEDNTDETIHHLYVGVQTNVTVPRQLMPASASTSSQQRYGSAYVAKRGVDAFLPESLQAFHASEKQSNSDEEQDVFGSVWSTFATDPQQQCVLDVQGLSYSVPLPGKQKRSKQILHDINVRAAPGEMLAIMGPSGGGKTTLLNCIAARAAGSLHVHPFQKHGNNYTKPFLSGNITINDKPRVKGDKRRMGYVMQDDVLFDKLTVHETLSYTAALRMDGKSSAEHRQKRIDDVVRLLKLERCVDTPIGGAGTRGVSGGERKRVNIGNELMTDPPLIFLDEPTSGLDSATSLRLLSSLASLASAGRTIVTTIHQPSTQIFSCFDKLLLLAEGHVIYFGKASDAIHYFASPPLRQICPPNWNPADFFLELAADSKIARKAMSAWRDQHKRLLSIQDTFADKNSTTEGPKQPTKDMDSTVVTRENNVIVEMQPEQHEKKRPKWPTTFWQQYYILFRRALRQGKGILFTKYYIGQTIAMTTIVSLLWWRLEDSASTIGDRTGALFFCSIYWGFNSMLPALTNFPSERNVLKRERAGGSYRLSAYFLAKSTADVPLALLYPSFFVIIAYWLIGLSANAGRFFIFWLSVIGGAVTAQSFGVMVASWVMDFRKSTVVAVVCMLSFMLAGGFYVDNIPPFVSWISALGFVSYCFSINMRNEFYSSRVFECGSDGATYGFDKCPSQPITGDDIINQLDPYFTNIAANFGILILMTVVFRFVAYWGLRQQTKAHK